MNAKDSFCYLTQVAGGFKGSGDLATVGTYWNGSYYEWYGTTQQATGYQIGANYGCAPYITAH